MGANDRAVDHQISVITVGRQRLEHLLPDAGMAPTAEAFMDRLPLAIPFRQVALMRARTQNPKATIDKQAIIRTCTPRIANLAWRQGRNLRPLPIAQFISLNRHDDLRGSTRCPMKHSSGDLGILNVDPT
jgi:hypothetical protein